MASDGKYSPEYAPGEILVAFEGGNLGKEFAREFGSRLGYSIAPGEYSHGNGIFIYKTAEGKEEEALLNFKAQRKFVSWAERRDLKLERRCYLDYNPTEKQSVLTEWEDFSTRDTLSCKEMKPGELTSNEWRCKPGSEVLFYYFRATEPMTILN